MRKSSFFPQLFRIFSLRSPSLYFWFSRELTVAIVEISRMVTLIVADYLGFITK